jgi:Domain of unknown function (DUF4386)
MNHPDYSLKKQARLAGLFYLLHIITSIYGMIFVSSKINMTGDGIEIVENILANELLFRSGILMRLVSSVPWILLALSLYHLMLRVNGLLAKLLFAWMLLSVPIGFVAETFNISGLMIAHAELLRSADTLQRQDWVYLFLNAYNQIVSISEMFWGLWMLPFGLLVYKSGFIPRILGILLFIGGTGYIIECIVFVLSPHHKSSVSPYTMMVGSVGEISVMFWLLIKGVKGI